MFHINQRRVIFPVTAVSENWSPSRFPLQVCKNSRVADAMTSVWSWMFEPVSTNFGLFSCWRLHEYQELHPVVVLTCSARLSPPSLSVFSQKCLKFNSSWLYNHPCSVLGVFTRHFCRCLLKPFNFWPLTQAAKFFYCIC